MKNIFRMILVSALAALVFSCSKAESVIKVKNPAQAPVVPPPNPDPALTPTTLPVTTPTPEPIVTSKRAVALVDGELLPTPFGSQAVLNKMESQELKGVSKIQKKYILKTTKKTSLNFKGWENIEHSQCDTIGKPEVTAIVKIGDKETSAKYNDLQVIELNPGEELHLTIVVDNSLNCNVVQFQFAVIVTELTQTPPPTEPIPTPPPVVIPLITIEVKEFLSAGTFGDCVDLACFTRDLKTSTNKFENPNNKLEEITEDHFVLAPSIELICQNRRLLADNSGITNSTCKFVVNAALATPEIKIYRGEGEKSNLLGVDITEPVLLEKLCGKWPNINSEEKVDVAINATEKKEMPRLELSCSYNKELKVTKATFIGVLN